MGCGTLSLPRLPRDNPGWLQQGAKPPARPQTGDGVNTNAAASASAPIPSLNGYCICLMPLRGACLLAYHFWSSAKWHLESMQLSHKGTCGKKSAFGRSVSHRAPHNPIFTCLSAAAVWAMSFCCRVQTWPQALYLCWLTRIAPFNPCAVPEQQQLWYFLARVAPSHLTLGVSLLELHWGNTMLNGFVSLDLMVSSWAM